MLTPETSAARINELINHESIREWVCGQLTGVLDVTQFVENKDNIFFTAEHGGCGLLKREDGSYELHSFSLPSGRGRWVRDNFFKVRDWIFSNTNAPYIVTFVLPSNKMALGAVRICGFRKYEEIEDVGYYVLYRDV